VTNVKGTVKWYNDMKSYGFIEVEDGKDVFVHRNALPEGTTLREGDEVEFDIEESPKGPQAANVKKL
jgi:CspA family cold shock protein